MIITQTPFRMSFFGGGTDFEEFYTEYGGSVLSTTFDKYCYVTVRHIPRFFEHSIEAVYSKIERVRDVNEIVHPSIREAIKLMDMRDIRLVYDYDLPARSGLGSSSAFAVGMLNAFYAMKGKLVDKKKLADEAIYLERTLCKEIGGIQDQIAVAFGGFNRIDLDQNGYSVSPLPLSVARKKELESKLMLFFTGIRRFSSDIQKRTSSQLKEKTSELLLMKSLVDDAQRILVGKADLSEFGRLLDYSWNLKRGIGEKISNTEIDEMYKKAILAGATGGKLLGAGGGGYLLFYVEQEKQKNVMEALSNLIHVPFGFETEGTKIIHFSEEEYFLEE